MSLRSVEEGLVRGAHSDLEVLRKVEIRVEISV